METQRDMRGFGAVAITLVVAVLLVGGVLADATTNELDYQVESDWDTGLFTNTEVVNDDVQLAGDNTTGTWNTGLLANEVLTSGEVNVSLPTNTSATLTVEYYNSSADDVSSGTVQDSETFTLSDGSNDVTINHMDSYQQVAYDVELTRDSSTDSTPVLETLTATGEKSGLTWTVLSFLTAIIAVAGLLKILGFV